MKKYYHLKLTSVFHLQSAVLTDFLCWLIYTMIGHCMIAQWPKKGGSISFEGIHFIIVR